MPRFEQLGRRNILDDARRLMTVMGSATGAAAPHEILGPQHTNTGTSFPIQGAMILAQLNADDEPIWDILQHPLAAGYALVTDATDVAWDQTPTWTGDHTWDDGTGDSPSLVLVGGSNDDTAKLYLDDDAVSGNSDLVVQLVANDDDTRLIVEQLGGTDVAYISGAGNAWFEGNVMLTDDAFVGISGGGQLVYDTTPNPDQIEVTAADLYFATTAHGIIHVDGNAAGNILVADGTRYVPGDLSDIGGAPDDAQYVVLALDGDLSAERVLVAGDSLTATDGGANGNITLDLDTPGTLTVSTANNAAAPHLHTVTSSSNPGAAASLLATDATGALSITGILGAAEYISHIGDADTYIQFTDDQITLHAGGSNMLVLVEGATDYINVWADVRLNANELYLDSDDDSYLYASADDVIDLVIPNATAEFGLTLNGAEDFTFTANNFNVLTGSSIQLSEYMYHAGDADTYLRYQTDHITLRAGGVDMIDIVEGAADYIAFGSTTIDGNFTALTYAMDGNSGVSVTGSAGGFQAYAYTSTATEFPFVQLKRSVGARGSESAAQADDILGRFGAGGYGASAFHGESTGYMQARASQNFTDANMGTHLCFATTPDNSTTPAERMRVDEGGLVKIASGFANILAQLHVDQSSTTGAIPVLILDQADVDVEFIHFYGTAAAANLTRSIVDEGDQASETREGWIKIYVTDDGNQITDQAYYIPIYTLS